MITQDDIRVAARLEHLHADLRAAKRRLALLILALLAEFGLLALLTRGAG